MKKRHIGKVNIIPNKKKDMIKFLNSPNALEKLAKLGNIAQKMSTTQQLLSEKKYDDIDEWAAFAITYMSLSLFEKTKQNGFQQELTDLVAKYSTFGETDDTEK